MSHEREQIPGVLASIEMFADLEGEKNDILSSGLEKGVFFNLLETITC